MEKQIDFECCSVKKVLKHYRRINQQKRIKYGQQIHQISRN